MQSDHARTVPPTAPFRRVLTFTFGHWRRHAGLVAATAGLVTAATLVDILVPLFAGRLIDALAGPGAELSSAMAAVGWIVGLGLVYVVLRHGGFRSICRLTPRIMKDMGDEAFWRVQRFSTDWHANNFAGATVRRISRGMWAMDLIDDVLLVGILPAVIVLIGATALLALQWPMLGLLVGTGSVLFVLISGTLVLRYVAPAAQISNALDSRLGGLLADSIGCNAVVKSFGAEKREDGIIDRATAEWSRRTTLTWFRGTTNGTTQLVFMVVMQGSVLALMLWLWNAGRASPGDVAYVLGTYALIHGYLREVGMHIRNLQQAVNDMEDLVDFAALPLGIEDRPDARPLVVDRGGIAFEDVTFRYPGQTRPLYDRFSLTVAPGERIGLVGHSGSGKSTFVKLVQRLHDVDGGRIAIDGQDIAGVTQESLRAQVALVPQDPALFHRSLAENIAYGCPGADMDAIVAAAKRAHAHEFIKDLPRGYDTPVGERGVKLSGGERQRVALARAILADAPILILDEATSSLDSVSEALIQDAVETLVRGRTTIIVAHRLSTVQRVDRILVFDRGRIVEQGRHADLVRREGGRYRALFETQTLGLAGEQKAA
jgi:ATP-binding cassette subfamily B protein